MRDNGSGRLPDDAVTIAEIFADAGDEAALAIFETIGVYLGYAIPPQADAGWIGEAGPGPSYLDEGSGGPQNEFTQRNTTIMTWNRLEGRTRAEDFDRALKAEVRDALWMLSRQWQMGEFEGEDGGSPVSVRLRVLAARTASADDQTAVRRLRGGRRRPLRAGRPGGPRGEA